MRRIPGFTLVELLVVITIIVVLLSLLAPALDTAIYQAELAVCATRLNAQATTCVVYAMEHRRFYFYRQGVQDSNTNWQPEVLSNGGPLHDALTGRATARHDDRPLLNRYMPISRYLNDPLSKAVDFEVADIDATVYSAYYLWAGWQYSGPAGGQGMMKIGDRFVFNDSLSDSGNPLQRSYALLASDRNYLLTNSGAQGSHPDHDGKMFNVADENSTYFWGGALKFTISTWLMGAGPRGPMDMNAAHDDGSVKRVDHTGYNDARMSAVAVYENGTGYTVLEHISLPRP
jgi:prepilin-type N-terminal cleavage/methylation domain-containing protein